MNQSATPFKFSEILTYISTTAFVLTVSFIYGFSLSSKLNLFTYMTLNDYFNYSLKWLTPVLFGFGLGFILQLFFSRVEKGATEEEIIKSSPFPKFTKYFRKYSEKAFSVIFVGGAIVLTIYSFFAEVPKVFLYNLWQLGGAFSWVAFFLWYLKIPKLANRWSIPQKVVLLVAPAMIIFSLFGGMLEGEMYGLPTNKNYYKDQLRLTKAEEVINGKVIFSLNNFIIFLNTKDLNFSIYPINQVRAITTFKEIKKLLH